MEDFIKLKIDFHIHSSSDYVGKAMEGYKLPTPEHYIDRASQLAFGAISFTNHSTWCDVHKSSEYAARKGVILIPGIEMCVQGRHVLLYNFAHLLIFLSLINILVNELANIKSFISIFVKQLFALIIFFLFIFLIEVLFKSFANSYLTFLCDSLYLFFLYQTLILLLKF